MRAGDTIVALSSGALPSGVAVIRVSGPASGAILHAIHPKGAESRRLLLADIRLGGEVLDRGLVVLTFRTMRARTILASLAGALRGGGVRPSAHLDEQIDVDHVVFEHSTPFPYQLDGDYLGETERLEFRHVPDAVRLVMPR